MNKNVMLTISGLHSDTEQDSGSVETAVRAEYFNKSGTHYLLYEEKEEGFAQVTKCRIKFKENVLELTRQGLLHTHMIFEAGKNHMTSYQTPYGQMMLGIDTESVQMEESDKRIRVIVEYKLEADGEYLSDSRIEISVVEC